MILNLITRASIKTYLGITATTWDSAIDALIPVVSSDVRRILNNDFNGYMYAIFDSSSAYLTAGDYRKIEVVDGKSLTSYIMSSLQVGQVVYHANIPEGTYITAADPETGIYTLSATPTGAGTYICPSVLVSQLPTIAKMVWYKLKTQNTTSAFTEKLSSISYGSVSKAFADSEINRQYNYPQTLINDLGCRNARIG